MSEVIIGAAIGAIGSIVGNIISSTSTRISTGKLATDERGNCILPHPFPCAWCDYDLVCDEIRCTPEGSFTLSFDFLKCKSANGVVPFVSMVFQFPEPLSLQDHKTLSFDLNLDCQDFNQVGVEIKNNHGDYNRKPIICTQGSGWKSYSIDLRNSVRSDILGSVKEICFVVKKDYFKNGKKLRGSFTLRNIVISRD